MKRNFIGYYKDKDLVQILRTKDVVIVLDSSVLCNLYGLHDEIWKPILEMLNVKRDCLWLPYIIASNYHKGIVTMLVNKIELLVNIMNKLKQTTELISLLPFSFSEIQNYKDMSKKLSKKLIHEIAMLKQQGKKDSELREAISKLYDGLVGDSSIDPDPKSFRILSYSEVTETDALSGNSQIEDKMHSTASNKQPQNDPNDVTLHTLIKLSKDKHRDVLYVISEPSKYWSVFIGRTSYGPNPEHQSYFNRNTDGHNFYCCTFASFMQKLSVSIGVPISEETRNSLNKISYGEMLQNDEGAFAF